MNIKELFGKMKEDLIYEKLDMQNLINEIGSQLLVKTLLENIGNTHSLIRENVLGINYRLITEELLQHSDYIDMLNTCLGTDHLLKGIGSKNCDSVFSRSFASLRIGHIIELDSKRGFLTHAQYMAILNKAIEYAEQEADWRGWVAEKGWAMRFIMGLCCSET